MAGNYLSGMLSGCMGGWIKYRYNQLSPKLGGVWAWAKLGNLSLYVAVWFLIVVQSDIAYKCTVQCILLQSMIESRSRCVLTLGLLTSK